MDKVGSGGGNKLCHTVQFNKLHSYKFQVPHWPCLKPILLSHSILGIAVHFNCLTIPMTSTPKNHFARLIGEFQLHKQTQNLNSKNYLHSL